MAQPTETQESLFERLRSYSFLTDLEFANGLSIILGHPGSPATEAEIEREDDLVLQAKCFFFSRKEKLTPPLDFAAYKSWLASQSTGDIQEPNTAEDQAHVPPEQSAGSSATDAAAHPEPVYPSSFAHIVELITTGQPVPGIQEIPDTVLAGHDITSEKPRRRKPWEKDETTDAGEETTSNPP